VSVIDLATRQTMCRYRDYYQHAHKFAALLRLATRRRVSKTLEGLMMFAPSPATPVFSDATAAGAVAVLCLLKLPIACLA